MKHLPRKISKSATKVLIKGAKALTIGSMFVLKSAWKGVKEGYAEAKSKETQEV
jgi:hypothetical protein|tara:strand:- start:2708 stop:2869 length:162 start_codon:yes stop_codon:yes gene_type:complete